MLGNTALSQKIKAVAAPRSMTKRRFERRVIGSDHTICARSSHDN